MDERGYLFLFSIAGVVACEATVGEDSGPPTPLESACEAFGTAYVECFDDEGPAVQSACREVADEIEPHGPACIDAMEEWFACIAELDCPMLVDRLPETCRPTYVAGRETCPELFSFCAAMGSGAGGSGCGTMASECLDGGQYSLQCDLMGDTYQCTCTANGTLTARFGDDDPCGIERLGELAAMHCGFPEDVEL